MVVYADAHFLIGQERVPNRDCAFVPFVGIQKERVRGRLFALVGSGLCHSLSRKRFRNLSLGRRVDLLDDLGSGGVSLSTSAGGWVVASVSTVSGAAVGWAASTGWVSSWLVEIK